MSDNREAEWIICYGLISMVMENRGVFISAAAVKQITIMNAIIIYITFID